MTSQSGFHDQKLVFLYAVQALGPSDIQAAEEHIAACIQCQEELASLRPVVQSFASWHTDVLRPSTSLWEGLAQRITEDTGREPVSALSPSAQPEWEKSAPGISVKILASDHEKHRVSMLVRLAPGTEYPPHCHAGVEELHLLHGKLMIDDKTLYPGDYFRADPGSVDRRVWSDTGCTCVLLTSTRDELL